MTDVLATDFDRQCTAIFDERMREMYDALPHDYKAELVDGELHVMSPSGESHGRAAAAIMISLYRYEGVGHGRAYGNTVGFSTRRARRRRARGPRLALRRR